MKIAAGILLIIVALPVMGFAHAEIFFPKLFSPSELPTTGIVLLNADPTIATVNLYFLSAAGMVLSAMPPVHIPPGGQFAKTADELFPGMTAEGWVYVLTDTEGMQAFWLTYDAALTFLDGAEAAQYETTGADQIIPLVTADTELSVVSLQSLRTTLPVTVRLFGADVELAPAFQKDVATAGGFRARAGDMFPGVDFSQALYMRITTPGAAIASTALIRGFQVPIEAAVINGINAGTTLELDFPHIVNGTLAGSSYVTTIGVTNLSSAPQTVTITFTPEAGDPIVTTRVVSGHGALRETAGTLFGVSSDFQTGWVRVNGTAPIAGFASYAETVGGALAVVPASVAQKNLFFLHIADGAPFQTGTGTPQCVLKRRERRYLCRNPRRIFDWKNIRYGNCRTKAHKGDSRTDSGNAGSERRFCIRPIFQQRSSLWNRTLLYARSQGDVERRGRQTRSRSSVCCP